MTLLADVVKRLNAGGCDVPTPAFGNAVDGGADWPKTNGVCAAVANGTVPITSGRPANWND